MIEEREKFIKALEINNLCKKERKIAEEKMKGTDIKAHGKELPFSYLPLILNEKDTGFLESLIRMADTILHKVIGRYLKDPEYRKLFQFSKDMEKLILLPCNYETMIPVGRYDIFFDENTGNYQICEFNTDGAGGMSRDYEMSLAILESFYDQDFIKNNHLCPVPVIDRMVTKLLQIYHSDKNAIDQPVFCVTDFREEGVFSDFDRFIRSFIRHGVNCRFTDIRDLKYDGINLIDKTDGTVINGVYRRAVTSVVLDHPGECQGLIRAMEDEKVVVLGHFRTSIVHSKMIHAMLYHEETLKMLTDHEKEWVKMHIPFTFILDKDRLGEDLLNKIYDHKDQWILKPVEGFASQGVICGMDQTEEEWISSINKNLGNHYMIQYFCQRYKVPVLKTSDDNITQMNLMMGVFGVGGHFAGCYNRAGNEGIIDFNHEGICVPTLLSD